MKTYILIRESLPVKWAVTAAAHAGAAILSKWGDHPDTKEWLEKSFKKVVCQVDDMDFGLARALLPLEDSFVLTESALDNQATALIFRPRKEWPKSFKSFRLYG